MYSHIFLYNITSAGEKHIIYFINIINYYIYNIDDKKCAHTTQFNKIYSITLLTYLNTAAGMLSYFQHGVFFTEPLYLNGATRRENGRRDGMQHRNRKRNGHGILQERYALIAATPL